MRTPFVSLNSWLDGGTILQGADPAEIVTGGPSDWPLLAAALERHRDTADRPDRLHPAGAAVGYFTYEGGFWFAFYPRLVAAEKNFNNPRWRAARRAWREDHPKPDRPVSSGQWRRPASLSWRSNLTRAQYTAAVRRAQDYIRAGDIYQVNLAQRFGTGPRPTPVDPYALFQELCWRSPAPGAAFIDTGGSQILSSSPELFLQIQGRAIRTRPIKGTRPRDRDPLRDQQLAYELMTDPKELAELIMITDLERNDLGRICEFGSVTVPELLQRETFAQVHHLVSTVEGTLRPGVGPVEALAACFPGGSITGAPKKRAMEIIAELEPGPRGVFTGAIGYFGFNGDAAFSIAIRTLVAEADGELHAHAGSGITAGSDPDGEYEETLHKASGMKLALERFLHHSEGEVAPPTPHGLPEPQP
ncbi:MAG: aminodeoxychorismate synthase component I [Verrucomicrobiota bacterium]